MEHYDITIVGGGIVGLATAYKLNIKYPNKKILVLEKEKEVGYHQTGHNSGVIHSGIYYKPGSYKAQNCLAGRKELVKFAKEHKIPHDICGKIIVATDKAELPHMNTVYQRGLANGVEGIELIGAAKIKEIEPYCAGIEAIWVPCAGIINYKKVAQKYAALIEGKFPQSKVLTQQEVKNFKEEGEKTIVYTNQKQFLTTYLISATGLQSDRMAKKQNIKLDTAILGFRGDYFDLTAQAKHKVKHLIYPIPNPKFPFLGVHFTRMIEGGIECGPNAVFVFDREGYHKTAFSFKDTKDAFAFNGTWKFFAKHWRFGLDEYRRAYSKRLFLDRLQRLIPSLTLADIVASRSGIRAMALDEGGEMVDDFKIERKGRAIHVLNAPSPAATASLAIGQAIEEMATTYFNLN